MQNARQHPADCVISSSRRHRATIEEVLCDSFAR